MASKLTEDKGVKTIEELMEEDVSYTAPYGATADEQPIFVAVNGDSVRIQRGETVTIKRKFYEVLRNAAEQERASKRYQRLAQQGALNPVINL